MKRVFIITGAYGSIGKAIARNIANDLNNKVVLVGRNKESLEDAQKEIIQSTSNQEIQFEVVDLSRQESVKTLAERWKGPLHVLINNASTTPRQRTETPEGIEAQWATNVLGYFWMMKYMSKFMKESEDARIVNVASYWAGGLDLADPEFKNRHYNNDTAYRQSKQADRMLSVAFAEKLNPYGITVNAAHPGDVRSKLSTNLGYGGFETPDQGAETPVWLATSEDVKGLTGKYFEHLREENCRFSNDKKAVSDLVELCNNTYSA